MLLHSLFHGCQLPEACGPRLHSPGENVMGRKALRIMLTNKANTPNDTTNMCKFKHLRTKPSISLMNTLKYTPTNTYLNAEFPQGSHWYPRNGSKVIHWDKGARLCTSNTGHSLGGGGPAHATALPYPTRANLSPIFNIYFLI